MTFNIRTLNRIGKLLELTALAVEYNVDIICIQEHRYTHSEDIKYHDNGNGWMLATVSAWKNSVNATVEGVGILIGPKALKSLNSIERIQPRMMVATFNGLGLLCYGFKRVQEEIPSEEASTLQIGSVALRGSLNKFPDFFVWALLLIVHT